MDKINIKAAYENRILLIDIFYFMSATQASLCATFGDINVLNVAEEE